MNETSQVAHTLMKSLRPIESACIVEFEGLLVAAFSS